MRAFQRDSTISSALAVAEANATKRDSTRKESLYRYLAPLPSVSELRHLLGPLIGVTPELSDDLGEHVPVVLPGRRREAGLRRRDPGGYLF